MKNETTAAAPRSAEGLDRSEPGRRADLPGADEATRRLVGLRASLRFLEDEAQRAGMKLTATLIAAAADAALDETRPTGWAGAN